MIPQLCEGVIEADDPSDDAVPCTQIATDVVEGQALCAVHGLQLRYNIAIAALHELMEKTEAANLFRLRGIAGEALHLCGELDVGEQRASAAPTVSGAVWDMSGGLPKGEPEIAKPKMHTGGVVPSLTITPTAEQAERLRQTSRQIHQAVMDSIRGQGSKDARPPGAKHNIRLSGGRVVLGSGAPDRVTGGADDAPVEWFHPPAAAQQNAERSETGIADVARPVEAGAEDRPIVHWNLADCQFRMDGLETRLVSATPDQVGKLKLAIHRLRSFMFRFKSFHVKDLRYAVPSDVRIALDDAFRSPKLPEQAVQPAGVELVFLPADTPSSPGGLTEDEFDVVFADSLAHMTPEFVDFLPNEVRSPVDKTDDISGLVAEPGEQPADEAELTADDRFMARRIAEARTCDQYEVESIARWEAKLADPKRVRDATWEKLAHKYIDESKRVLAAARALPTVDPATPPSAPEPTITGPCVVHEAVKAVLDEEFVPEPANEAERTADEVIRSLQGPARDVLTPEERIEEGVRVFHRDLHQMITEARASTDPDDADLAVKFVTEMPKPEPAAVPVPPQTTAAIQPPIEAGAALDAKPAAELATPGRLVRFTPERNEVLKRDYPAGVQPWELLDRLLALPGPGIPPDRVAIQASKLGLRRPPGFIAQPRPKPTDAPPAPVAQNRPTPGTDKPAVVRHSQHTMPSPPPYPVADVAPKLQRVPMPGDKPVDAAAVDAPVRKAAPPPVPPIDTPPRAGTDGCCWVMNDTKPYKMCGAPTKHRKPYCDKHSLAAKQKGDADVRNAPVRQAGGGKGGPSPGRLMRAHGQHSRFAPFKAGTSFKSAALPEFHPAVVKGRTLFPGRVRKADSPDKVHLLVSGHSSPKTGYAVFKGPWRGLPIYTLTLEERATCPRACENWRTCFGNGMPYPIRTAPGPELIEALPVELGVLSKVHKRGFVVRLHVLGDFYSFEYVRAWISWMRRFKRVRVFGYTAHPRESVIGEAIRLTNAMLANRWMIRFSGPATAEPGMGVTTIWRQPEAANVNEGIVCPAQAGQTSCCGTCGLCWHPAAAAKRIVFIGHGKLGAQSKAA